MDKRTALEIAKAYKAEVMSHFPVVDVYLYGSYSHGSPTSESDIDIAVVVAHRDEECGGRIPMLWKLGRRVSYLIEPVLLALDEDNPLYADVIRTGIRIS